MTTRSRRTEHASIFARRPVELAAAGRQILDQHKET